MHEYFERSIGWHDFFKGPKLAELTVVQDKNQENIVLGVVNEHDTTNAAENTLI